MSYDMSRRSFLKKVTAVAASLAVAPGIMMAGEAPKTDKKKKKVTPPEKLKILGVGIGGRGAADLAAMETEEFIGLCDVDWKYADHVFKKYPNAKKYNDYRVMFDELLDQADAVMIATADHTHAVIAAQAIAAGKHVYCEKPLTLAPAPARPSSGCGTVRSERSPASTALPTVLSGPRVLRNPLRSSLFLQP